MHGLVKFSHDCNILSIWEVLEPSKRKNDAEKTKFRVSDDDVQYFKCGCYVVCMLYAA